MMRILIMALASCWTQAGLTQTVRVQSGEHEGFSRLVLPIGTDRSWTLDQDGNEWSLGFSPSVTAFDLDRVYQLIPRDRLAAITEDGGLRLSIGCACSVTAFRHQARFLVIDIADAPDATEPDGQDVMPAGTASPLLPLAQILNRPQITLDTGGAAPDLGGTDPTRLMEAAAIMSEQLARAAAAGLLEASTGQPLSHATPVRRTDAILVEGDRATGPPEIIPALPLPIRAETAFDAAQHADQGAEPQRTSVACQGHSLPIAEWAHGIGFEQEIGTLRAALYDGRDVLRPDGVLQLARYYLYHGFGAEAAFWLNQLSDPPPSLLAISHILDHRPGAAFATTGNTAQCSAAEVLWRVLGQGEMPDLSDEQLGALQQSYAALPPGLRDQVGSDLAGWLQENGHAAAARNIRDIMLRGGRVSDDAQLLLDLSLGIGAPNTAQDALSAILYHNRTDAPSALAHLLTVGDLSASDDLIEAAEATLRETGLDTAPEGLWHQLIMAYAAAGDIERVGQLIGEGLAQDDGAAAILTPLFATLIAQGDTAGIAMMASRFADEWTATGSDAGRIRQAAIGHLRDAGLLVLAEELRPRGSAPLILPASTQIAPPVVSSARSAWESGNWAGLANEAAGPHAEIAQTLLRLDQGAAPQPQSATAISLMLDQSRETRAQIVALLREPSLSSPAAVPVD